MAYPSVPGIVMNPSVPVHISLPIPGGICPGNMIILKGTFNPGCDRFSINLETDQPSPDIILHFDVRFNERCVVRNTMIGGNWGPEERHGGMPFVQTSPFEIIILVETNRFKIAVNGKHFTEYDHRLQKELATFVSVTGKARLNCIKFQGGPSVPVHISLPIRGGICPGKMIILKGTFNPGCDRFSINLQTDQPSPDKPSPDIILHFDVRFNERCVVRNTMIGGNWGPEERHGGMPFVQTSPFEIIILVETNRFKIAVNGKHFTEYDHRLQKELATFVSVTGKARLNCIKFQGGPTPGIPAGAMPCGMPAGGGYSMPAGGVYSMPAGGGYSMPAGGGYSMPAGGGYSMPAGGGYSMPAGGGYSMPAGCAYTMPAGGAYSPPMAAPGPGFPNPPDYNSVAPIYNPPVPFTSQIPGSLVLSRMIFITGTPHSSASRFSINLQNACLKDNDIGLHFDVRLRYGSHTNLVVRNHRQNNTWGIEETQQLFFPFTPSGQFDMIILIEKQGFKVAVNNQHFIEFIHRILPLTNLDTLDISGDVRLTMVRFQ